MALSVASGSFLSATATGNFAVTGVGFQGKVLMLWGGRHATGLGSHVNGQFFMGVATDSTHRWSVGHSMNDNVGTSEACRTQNLTSCYREAATATGGATHPTIIDLDFVSWDSDGFTLNQVTADATASRIFYCVLGGTDLTNASCGSFDFTTDTTYAVSGLGWQPDLVGLAYSEHFRTAPTAEGNQGSAMTAFGWARAASRWNLSAKASSGATTPSGHCYFERTGVLAGLDPNTTSLDSFFNFTSFDAGGFSIAKVGGSTAQRGLCWLALKGTYQAKLGSCTQKTTTGTVATTGVGFTPEALLFASVGLTLAQENVVTADDRLTLGVALSASNRRASCYAQDGNDPSIADSSASEAVCVRHLTAGTPTVVAEADLASFDADGFTLNWTTADATAREAMYLALASAAGGGPPPGRRLLLMGVG